MHKSELEGMTLAELTTLARELFTGDHDEAMTKDASEESR